MQLLIFGLGYTATHFASRFGGHFAGVTGTVRDALIRPSIPGVECLRFDGQNPSSALLAAIERATHLLVIALCVGFVGLIWWVWRRASHADLALIDVMATPKREGLRPVAKAGAYWDLVQLIALLGGLALLGVAAAVWN